MKIFNHYVSRRILLLVAVEFALFLCAPFIAAMIRFDPDLKALEEEIGAAQHMEAAIFAGILSLSAIAMGLYSRRLRYGSGPQLVRFCIALAGTVVTMALVFYVVPSLFIGRGLLGLTAMLAFGAFVGSRFAFKRFCDDAVFRRRLLVYGTGRRVTGLAQLRRRTDRGGFDIIGYVDVKSDVKVIPEELWIKSDMPLVDICKANDIHEIVVGIDDRRVEFPFESLLACKLRGIEVTDAVEFLEREAGKVRLEALNSTWFLFSPGFSGSRAKEIGIRVLDIVGSTILLAVTWPIMLLAAIAILLEDGPSRPILYRQRRVGCQGRMFEIVKFRSMHVDAERAGNAVWAEKKDPRVTRVGGALRKLRVDELPQLWNVVAGDLSLVGPRPERPEFVDQLNRDIPYYQERHRVKPGITGWAQLCYPYGSSTQDTREKLQYDLYYVKNRCIGVNLMILMRTIEVILFGKGAR